MVTFVEFQNLDIRTAKILEVIPHPNADRLYVLKIEVGEEQKQLVAGIRKWYTPEELIGKMIVIINNLEPATIRGVESQGMLLAAGDDERVVILTTEREIKSGARIK
ncbi:MAG: methionine--tRNA ligase subunit beta [Omnitrophica bacterium RIFCSPLOWO2_12_FULL_44_17]|uniref:Methionine--tRNA ligase n=1 Tax=Candidatus Danuiimicrobium aquiferis TaxID=1801832 RepID=A0A1G1L316_9BACT|nr:MAG: methionine--tRNA ligase subunit beta [Omnitrophica bacterium RIFCSPHIGHO2_02_FULL_45_28]OGW92443.1 MAG: methionine--tRNA ligase subunit beta [Omnitrophica bacterium RIFCSPHIGHO2_12_FULL_44_12]OGW99551.1 MAG: methionine--tRNA ligase subunit beta [Omnitrophica bacterium RIFCSPLOWO2_12_FULL_44_17]OGX04000.1 MAG: methionine--tRNA ligase subunit beta [Omnitrophica bacterium RIFCSPLOWO2_02_FULL_44_11]